MGALQKLQISIQTLPTQSIAHCRNVRAPGRVSYIDQIENLNTCIRTEILVYLNGNNAAEGENNIKYANSYPMN